MCTAFDEKETQDIDLFQTLEQVSKEKHKKKYGVPVFRRIQVKKSASSLHNPPKSDSSLRNTRVVNNK